MILAADLGSTNLKTAVFTLQGQRLGEGSSPLPYELHTSDVAELCPSAVGEAFDEAVREAIRSAAINPDAVVCTSFTSQAQTFCVCDAQGVPCGPFIGWADNRACEEAVILQKELGGEFHRLAGWPEVQPGLLLAKALWWRKRHGLAPDQRLVSLPSFLAMRLGAPLVTDRNLAAMTGCYNIPDDRWWTTALVAAGLSAAHLGRVVAVGEQVPIASNPPSHLLPALRTIVMAGNDHTAGAVGCGCTAGRSILTLGTAGVFYRHAGMGPGPFSPDGLWGPYPLGGCYELRVTPHACAALDWADELLFGSVNSPRFVEAASRAPEGCGGVVFDPAKWGSPEAWSGGGSQECKARAVLEGVARELTGLVGPFPDADAGEIVILGGGSRLTLWVEMLERMFGGPLSRAETDGLYGAALLAGMRSER